ncbi:hypothetical protein, partial [Enterobacter intestinihominis]
CVGPASISAAGQVAGGASRNRPTVLFYQLNNLIVFYTLLLIYPKNVMSQNKIKNITRENTIQKKKNIAYLLASTSNLNLGGCL